MADKTRSLLAEDLWEESSRKRMRSNSKGEHFSPASDINHEHHTVSYTKEKSSSTAKLAPQTVAPFLAKHVPAAYAPLGARDRDRSAAEQPIDPNSRYCYRHRPDMLCRRQADEPSMEALQKGIEAMPQEDRQAIVQVWSLFSAAPSKQRNLMLQGILAQCCFPQLSFLSANVRELIKIDFLAALPSEVSYRILCFLDTTSLCKAAQVSRKWRQLADDDVVWHRMCEQHIERKCTKCGWGLPLMDRKKLRETKREMQLRATGRGRNEWSPAVTPLPQNHAPSDHEEQYAGSDVERSSDGKLSPVLSKRPMLGTTESDYFRKTRPWKDVYKDRFKVGSNWKYGRCSIKVLRGHTNGIMALQFIDNILATGSYDATIKLWDLDTGEEIRTLRGHTMGIRCLQFDDTKLISGSLDRTLKVWNWRTGECLSTYNGHADGVISLHFDSNLLASGSSDHTARVWNFQDKSVFCLRGHTDWINSVKIDSTSRTLFTASDDCTIKLWDLDTKKCIRTYEGHVGHVQQLVTLPPEFDADEDPIVAPALGSPTSERAGSVSASASASVSVSVPCDEPTSTSQPSSSPTSTSSLFPTQPYRPLPPAYILTSALDATVRLWEVSSGRCIRTFFGHVEGVWAVAADNLRMVSGAHDRTVKVWDPRTGRSEKTFAGHAGPVTCIGLSDGRMCSGGEDGEVRVYDFGG